MSHPTTSRSSLGRPAVFLFLVLMLALGVIAPAAQVQAAPLTESGGVKATVTGDLVNLRDGPGTGYAVVGRAKNGEALTAVGKTADGSWLQVSVSGKKGWVNSQLVTATGSVASLPVVKVAAPKAAAPKAAAAPRSTAVTGFFAPGIQFDPGNLGESVGGTADLGLRWAKWQVPWKDFEGSGPGQRNWPDDVVNAFNGAGINLMASIVKAPQWARGGNPDMSVEGPPADPNTYAAFVGAFAARYCGRVQAIEVWNEQNLHYEWGNERLDAARYVRLLAAAYRAIKAACPSTIVVSGAPTPTGALPPAAVRDTTYLEQMYRAGLRSYSDAIGVHPSGYGNPPDVRFQDLQAGNYSRPSHVTDPSFYFRNTMEQYRNIMVKYGDGGKRLWPTEFGWASSGNPVQGYEYAAYNSEQQQGEYIVRAYDIMRNWGWVGVAFLWNLNYKQGEQAQFRVIGRPAYGMIKGMPK
jgi:SH3-like domain-containing protein